MQTKTIQKIIETKLTEWLNTITDNNLSTDVKYNLLVSGGSIASMLLDVPVNDYDVYLMDMDVCKRLVQYYTNAHPSITIFDGRNKQSLVEDHVKSYGNKKTSCLVSLENLKEDQIKLFFNNTKGYLKLNTTDCNYKPIYFSPNAITLTNDLQIVLRFWGTAEQIHKTFDFVHATNYFTFNEGLVTNKNALESIITKELKYQGSYYPVTSIIRAKKFIKRGFDISASEMLKIMFQISQLDLSDINVLEEQLIGVDVSNFDLLISTLRNEGSDKIAVEYFNTLIDKVFNSTEE